MRSNDASLDQILRERETDRERQRERQTETETEFSMVGGGVVNLVGFSSMILRSLPLPPNPPPLYICIVSFQPLNQWLSLFLTLRSSHLEQPRLWKQPPLPSPPLCFSNSRHFSSPNILNNDPHFAVQCGCFAYIRVFTHV